MKQQHTDYCEECQKMVVFTITERKNIIRKIRGEVIIVDEKVAVCSECGNDILNKPLDNENLKNSFKKFAETHDLISIDEIKRIRQKYNINQKLFSKSLGFGEITIQRYERGALPTKAFSQIIKQSDKPEKYLEILEQNKNKITENEFVEIKKKIERFLPKETPIKNKLVTVSVSFIDKEDALIRKYVKMHNMDISTFIRQAVIEKIENEYNLRQ